MLTPAVPQPPRLLVLGGFGLEFDDEPLRVSAPAQRLLAYLGPAIGPCCYEVGSEVAAAWVEGAGVDAALALQPSGDRWRLDLRAANALLLGRAGLRREHLDASPVCTRCASENWPTSTSPGR